MPLLSLPCELLLDIIKKASADRCCPATVALAQTCQLLRSLTITHMYYSISIIKSDRLDKVLAGLLTSYDHIAACVRKLTLSTPFWYTGVRRPGFTEEDPGWRGRFQDILGACKELRELRLRDGRAPAIADEETFEASILEHLAPESRRSIEAILFMGTSIDTAMGCFNTLLGNDEFGALKTVKIQDTTPSFNPGKDYASRPVIAEAESVEWPQGKLESVRTFCFNMRPEVVTTTGCYFARTMPNVNVLEIRAKSDWIQSSLSTYAELGSHLTSLHLDFKRTQEHDLCETISKLSPKLATFVVTGSRFRFCHKMFAPNKWKQLSLLDIRCSHGCEELQPDLLRENIEKITQACPKAVMSISTCYPDKDLLRWNSKIDRDCYIPPRGNRLIPSYIAPLEEFENLSTAPTSIDSDEWSGSVFCDSDGEDEEDESDEGVDYEYEYEYNSFEWEDEDLNSLDYINNVWDGFPNSEYHE